MIKRVAAKHNYSLRKIIGMVGLSESTYYYQSKTGTKGRKKSAFTQHKDKGLVTEETVIQDIKSMIMAEEFLDCGYRPMTEYLKRSGYVINHKKVYRIMKESKLLKINSRIRADGTGRKFVKFRKIKTSRPFECLEMDIKMVWIPQKGKNAYLFSVIDVHTRKILVDMFAFSIKKQQVIQCLEKLLKAYDYPQTVVIRSDNGSQFIAYDVRAYLNIIGVQQEFTHVATPEENAHIEAYHGILKRDVFDKFEYQSFGEIEQILKRYKRFYNQKRIHGAINWLTPNEKWALEKHKVKYAKKSA